MEEKFAKLLLQNRLRQISPLKKIINDKKSTADYHKLTTAVFILTPVFMGGWEQI